MNPSSTPKFKILVPGITSSGDPGLGINPTVARGGFSLQQITLPNGTGRLGGSATVPEVPSAGAHTAAIKVVADEYWDPQVAAVPPFLLTEIVEVAGRVFRANAEFGAGHGSGDGPIADIADELAASLNTIEDVMAVSDGIDTVYITATGTDAKIGIKATNDMSEVAGDVFFEVYGSDGTLLSVAPELRRTFSITKSVKFQTPPEELP